MEVITNVLRKANKPHKCELCGLVINKGEIYSYQFNKDGGDVWSFKAHCACVDLATNLNLYDDQDNGVTEEIFKDQVREDFHYKTSDKYPNATWEEILRAMYYIFDIHNK